MERSYLTALYNLAASLAKADKYDLDVKKAIDQFKAVSGYFLPNYLNNPEIVEKIVAEYKQERITQSDSVQSLLLEKDRQTSLGNSEAVKELIHQIEEEERKPI